LGGEQGEGLPQEPLHYVQGIALAHTPANRAALVADELTDHLALPLLVQYTWWSFVPKTIYEQFRKFSNCYFLLVIVIQFIPVRIFLPLSTRRCFIEAASVLLLRLLLTSILWVHGTQGMSPFIPVASVIPLAFVILISALRELVEDIFRHIEDRKNNRSVPPITHLCLTIWRPSNLDHGALYIINHRILYRMLRDPAVRGSSL
jgi:hypothetical protein